MTVYQQHITEFWRHSLVFVTRRWRRCGRCSRRTMHGSARLLASSRAATSVQSWRRPTTSRRLHRPTDYYQSFRQQIPRSGINDHSLSYINDSNWYCRVSHPSVSDEAVFYWLMKNASRMRWDFNSILLRPAEAHFVWSKTKLCFVSADHRQHCLNCSFISDVCTSVKWNWNKTLKQFQDCFS